ncbi:MAG: hypothetical protein EKK29_16855 [Hyphomicrobiales bacterium]|nr:MAG: hypothetical protein EKK29_16855 [Hyphomicrobiales bacterium]
MIKTALVYFPENQERRTLSFCQSDATAIPVLCAFLLQHDGVIIEAIGFDESEIQALQNFRVVAGSALFVLPPRQFGR